MKGQGETAGCSRSLCNQAVATLAVRHADLRVAVATLAVRHADLRVVVATVAVESQAGTPSRDQPGAVGRASVVVESQAGGRRLPPLTCGPGLPDLTEESQAGTPSRDQPGAVARASVVVESQARGRRLPPLTCGPGLPDHTETTLAASFPAGTLRGRVSPLKVLPQTIALTPGKCSMSQNQGPTGNQKRAACRRLTAL